MQDYVCHRTVVAYYQTTYHVHQNEQFASLLSWSDIELWSGIEAVEQISTLQQITVDETARITKHTSESSSVSPAAARESPSSTAASQSFSSVSDLPSSVGDDAFKLSVYSDRDLIPASKGGPENV